MRSDARSESPGEDQDQQDDHDEAEATARSVAPASAMRPCRDGTEEHQNQDDEKDCTHAMGLSKGNASGRVPAAQVASGFSLLRPARQLANPSLNKAPGRRSRRRATTSGPGMPISTMIRPATKAERLNPIPQWERTRWPAAIRVAASRAIACSFTMLGSESSSS